MHCRPTARLFVLVYACLFCAVTSFLCTTVFAVAVAVAVAVFLTGLCISKLLTFSDQGCEKRSNFYCFLQFLLQIFKFLRFQLFLKFMLTSSLPLSHFWTFLLPLRLRIELVASEFASASSLFHQSASVSTKI